MSGPNHSNDNPDLQVVTSDLREGLQNSRQILRRSRYLIELSESDSASSGDEGHCAAAS